MEECVGKRVEGDRRRGRGVRGVDGICLLVVLVLAGAAAAQHELQETRRGDPFDQLIDDLPRSRKRVVWVAFQGAAPPPTGLGVAQDWLLPLAPDWESIDGRLREALARRYTLAAAPVLSRSAQRALDRLRQTPDDAETIARLVESLEVDAVFIAEVSVASRSGDLALVGRLLGGRSAPGAFVLESRTQIPGGLVALGTWNKQALLAYLLIGALFSIRLARGWASLQIVLPQAERDRHAAWTIHVSPRAAGGSSRKGLRLAPPRRISTHMAGKLNRFGRIKPGPYVVRVQRVFRDPETHEVTNSQSQERALTLRGWRRAQLRFEFAELVPVEVALRMGDDPLPEEPMIMGIKGKRDSVRYPRDGQMVAHLERGSHTIVAGFRDRVFEESVEVEGAAKRLSLEIDLSDSSRAVIQGCMPAVEPYVQGDLETAVEKLRESGDETTANLLLAEEHRAKGESEKATEFLAAAGRVREAAELSEGADDSSRTAMLYEQAGEFSRAAELFLSAGDVGAALRNFEEANDLAGAVRCALALGDRGRAVVLLERAGSFLDAARLALEMDDSDRAIACLQQLSFRDPHYGEACVQLAELFFARDELNLALQKLDEAASVFGSDSALSLREQIGNKLEESGRVGPALEVFETIRKRDIQYPGMEEKIRDLRARRSAAERPAAPASEGRSEPKESRYELMGEIGRGAMGIVYKARDRRLERIVALKRLPDSLKEHPTAVRLFLREARSAAALNHPNIVILHDADQEDGVYYLTMEYLEGKGLDQILKSGKISARDALRLAIQVSMGLEYAHQQRIVHRDIKPSNLFYTKGRKVKVMDFGLAKMIEEVRKASSVIAGTPYYMAPEQALGRAVDHRADLYAFGVTLFRMLTMRLPFEEGDVIYHHCHTPPPDPREYAADLPPALAEVTLRLMAKKPEDRPESTTQVKQSLVRILKTWS